MQDRIVINDGVKIQYRVVRKGDLTPLVFLHGGTSSLCAWEKILPFFDHAHHSLITVDLRGCGLSGKPAKVEDYSLEKHALDIERIMEEEKIHQVILVGHCFGSMVAVTSANLFPQKIEKLVLINPGSSLPWFVRFFPVKILLNFVSRLLLLFPPRKNACRTDYSTFVNTPDIELKRIWQDVSCIGIGAAVRQFLAFYDWKGKLYFRNLQTPALIIAGKKDSIFPPDETHKLVRSIRDPILEYIDGNHILVLNKPGEVAGYILDFIDRK